MSEINEIYELTEGFSILIIKLIQKYQWTEPIIRSKYKDNTYHKVYFRGVRNIDPKLILCKDNIVIPSKIENYI